MKCSASTAAFVFESSPPMTTSPSSFRDVAVATACANCDGVSILSRPEASMVKPPELR